jgi:DNA-binding response OmpR family regulator
MSRVLVIEDNGSIAEGVRANLEMEGYLVRVARDGEEGLALARSWSPQLVILDLMLPRMDGYHVLRALRAESLEMPVLILSARSAELEKSAAFASVPTTTSRSPSVCSSFSRASMRCSAADVARPSIESRPLRRS